MNEQGKKEVKKNKFFLFPTVFFCTCLCVGGIGMVSWRRMGSSGSNHRTE